MTEDEAASLLAEMIGRDPATEDVVNSMRARGRTNSKIAQCFRRHMLEDLGMSFSAEDC